MITKRTSDHGTYFEAADGQIVFWLEQSSAIHIQTKQEFGAPVELTLEDAVELAEQLIKLARSAEQTRT